MAKKTLADRIKQCIRARAIGRQYYKRADRLLEEIAKEMKPGEPIALSERQRAILVDLFATKFVVFKPLGFRRFELEIEDL
jgi:hypothetical protein